MEKSTSLQEFYANVHGVPENIKAELGHFNVFKLDDFASEKPKPMPFKRRDYYKISLVKGRAKVHYADKVIEVEDQVLVFSNPQIPYNWEKIDKQLTGFFCIFSEEFFHEYGKILSYPIFQPGGQPVFLLSDEQKEEFISIYQKMFEELQSEYKYKYDVLRNLIMEMVHKAIKLQPAEENKQSHSNASERISTLFMELLERQFPIEDLSQKMFLRSASEFAGQLNVHVNHLNRALKETMGKTTTDLITDRILQESKILLKHSNWNISEIANCLQFEEASHFSNFFKRQTRLSPLKFRKEAIV